MKIIFLILFIAISVHSIVSAQTYGDVSIGISNRDKAFVNIAVRKQFSEKFRAGVEIQSGFVNYRFIGGKAIDEGNSAMISIPVMWKIFQDDRIRLDFTSKAGVRFQSVSSSEAEKLVLEGTSSFGYFFEPGLIASLPISEKFSIQGGVTMPIIIESTPVGLFENNVSNIFLNTGYKLSEKIVFLFKANTGPAAGADGDSQKYTWSLRAGLRFNWGGKLNKSSLIIDPSY